RPGRARPLIQIGLHGEIEYSASGTSGLAYQVFLPAKGSRPGGGAELSQALAEAYLQLPSNLSGRVLDLAHQWVEGERDPAAIAFKIQERLRAEYRYDLSSPSGGTPDPIDHFLF